MQHKYLFEYAVIRLVPRVERGEFINVGVILYCAGERYLGTCLKPNPERIKLLFTGIDTDEVYSHLNAFECISKGGPDSGPIGLLDIASRFRWLTATRSTVIQTSKVHPGFCNNASVKITELFNELVA